MPLMNDALPYAATRAAGILTEALHRYTGAHPGGLRALAARLGIKQATVLSHMATGRIGIPLDRAEELAQLLDINQQMFCAAVLEQRAPSIFRILVEEGPSASPSDAARNADLRRALVSAELSPEQEATIRAILSGGPGCVRWLSENEAALLTTIRECRPMGLTDHDLQFLGGFLKET